MDAVKLGDGLVVLVDTRALFTCLKILMRINNTSYRELSDMTGLSHTFLWRHMNGASVRVNSEEQLVTVIDLVSKHSHELPSFAPPWLQMPLNL